MSNSWAKGFRDASEASQGKLCGERCESGERFKASEVAPSCERKNKSKKFY